MLDIFTTDFDQKKKGSFEHNLNLQLDQYLACLISEEFTFHTKSKYGNENEFFWIIF